jgi:hypothetical protein
MPIVVVAFVRGTEKSMEPSQPAQARNIEELFRSNGGRDELNLAEFPITLLSDRVPKGCKTLVFEDTVFDRQHGEVVTRKLTVTGSDAYGLPTAIDDEVLVALLQLTKLDGFLDPKVRLSRYELLRILGWKDVGKNYQRIEEALNRWMGVTLYYEKAWWDNDAKAWVDAKFHILDNVQIVGKSERERLRRRGQVDLYSSWFKWNEVVFKSFQADNLKRLDLDTYFNLKCSTAKRMFRFLDKRFYHRGRWEFDLDEFAFQHIGLSRSYDTGQIKAKLHPGIEELEAHGFLDPLQREERYTKVGRGRWRIILVQARSVPEPKAPSPPPPEAAEHSELVGELQRREITLTTAGDLVRDHPPERIRQKLEVFDWLLSKKDKRIARSPSGYLVKSIQDDYAPPAGFKSRADRERQAEAEARARRQAEEAKRKAAQEEKAREEAEGKRIKDFWEGLSAQDRERVRAEALTQAPSFLVSQYLRNEAINRKQADFYWQVILATYLDQAKGEAVPSSEPRRSAGRPPQGSVPSQSPLFPDDSEPTSHDGGRTS